MVYDSASGSLTPLFASIYFGGYFWCMDTSKYKVQAFFAQGQMLDLRVQHLVAIYLSFYKEVAALKKILRVWANEQITVS